MRGAPIRARFARTTRPPNSSPMAYGYGVASRACFFVSVNVFAFVPHFPAPSHIPGPGLLPPHSGNRQRHGVDVECALQVNNWWDLSTYINISLIRLIINLYVYLSVYIYLFMFLYII